jgi:ATP-dependent Clp protease ATP-binding subunit ClpC
MSEYSEKHEVSKLFGAPPGFVGYDDGGQLTEKVRKRPFSVILFDEIEKAHPDIFNALLHVLEDGHLTDSSGRKVDFRNTIIIMTTNLGSKNIGREFGVGFDDGDNDSGKYAQIKGKVKEELKSHFRPEFLNRVDDIIVFQQLDKEEVMQIADLMLKSVQERLVEKNITLNFTDKARRLIVEKGYDPVLGARPLRREITRDIEDELAEKILLDEITDNSVVTIDATNEDITGEFTFNATKPEMTQAA